MTTSQELNALEVERFKEQMSARCAVSSDGKHAFVNMEGLAPDYCAHCGKNAPTPNDCPKCKGLGYCRCEIASNE